MQKNQFQNNIEEENQLFFQLEFLSIFDINEFPYSINMRQIEINLTL